jgi:RimJ/RimL family protein N-acetyltransferase
MTSRGSVRARGITLRPWQAGDVCILHRSNTLAMTEHVGGPESDEAVEARQLRYMRMWQTGEARMFAIIESRNGADEESVGGVGWWLTTWHDQPVYEAGWSVVPEAQGRGIAKAAVALLIADARSHAERRLLTAFPSIENAPSNSVCASAGFRNHGVESFPFRATTLTVNAWALDLNPCAGA